ncbi:MAG: 3-deoxy-8-phosphooctulonate synthase [Chlamydiales bacterium]|nr:3-deoxy-8-phosphooctulonate synthase [Chlamydiia bacterium]MCP5506956.1 3-deoxy-8-phosphooctulonate synthase [Chlamydiales bacterium]
MKKVEVKNFLIGPNEPLTLITGPCVIESEEHCFDLAGKIKELIAPLPVNLIFKASYDKANRSSIHSFRGPGIEEGLRILKRVKDELDLPVVTDVHSPEEAVEAGKVCDLLQIPAFLCRQTDLIVAAAKTGRPLQVKKGQFLAPWDMKNVVEKITESGNDQIILMERGVTFGYNNLVSDMRAIPIMANLGHPVCFDATHSLQLPGGLGESTGGQREFLPTLAKAAVAAGAHSLFMEAHPNPSQAKSDATTVCPIDELVPLLEVLLRVYEAVNR